MAEDSKKPYGDVEYADPGYQSDKQHRYPVDTEEHARAAWSYINKASNASAYSSGDLAKVKAKIRAACKKFGIEISDDGEGDGKDDKSKAHDDVSDPNAVVCSFAEIVSKLSPDALESGEITFLPAGDHSITPISGGIGKPIQVFIDSSTAAEMEKQRQVLVARGKRPYFDFNHEDGKSSFWPFAFVWRNHGVVARGEWSGSGKKSVKEKDFRAFSPVFHVDDKRKEPARPVCCENARPNMGGLVNDPAFKNLPLWAKNDGSSVIAGASSAKNKGDTMTAEEIAALQAKKEELEAKLENLTQLASKNADDEVGKAQIDALRAQAEAADAELKIASLAAKNQEQAKEIEKRNREVATERVKAAVKRNAIAAKNLTLQNKLIAQATVEPDIFLPIIDGMVGNGIEGRIVTRNGYGGGNPSIMVTAEDPSVVFAKMGRLLQQSAKTSNREEKYRLSEEFAAVYASSFAEVDKNRDMRTRMINAKLAVAEEAIMAADVVDVNLGTLAGTLVTQRTLELLKFVFPVLTRFTTDFSDQPATFNQTIMTRIIQIPAVITYSSATGWQDSVAQTQDVPIVINNHKGIPITFGENMLASTMRRLFSEFAEASAYALAKAIVDSLYALLTDANYPNNYIVASTAFNRASVIDVGVQLTLRGVPLGLGNRTMLLWPQAFGNLEKDPAMLQFATNVPRPDIVTDGGSQAQFLVAVEAFNIYSAANMPSNNANLVGFAGSKSALCIATRTPNDYTSVMPGASFGNVQMVTDPDIGITVMQVQYVNHTMGTATSRLALMWGVAPGQTNAGELIKASAGSGSSR